MNILLLKEWLAEQGPRLIGARLKHVRQHDARSLLLDLHAEEAPLTLLLSIYEEFPALALVDDEASLPAGDTAESSFLKALTHSVMGQRLGSISQIGFDRSVLFTFLERDTYGEETLKILRHELVGRASNAYLISERGMVVSMLKRARPGRNRVRQIITGKPLPDPPPLEKFIASESTVEGLAEELTRLATEEGVDAQEGLEHFFTRRVAGCDVKLWPALEPLLPVEYDLDSLFAFIKALQKGDLTDRLFDLRSEGDANRLALASWIEAHHRQAHRKRESTSRAGKAAARLEQLRQQRALVERADEVEHLGLRLLEEAAEVDSNGRAREYIGQWQRMHPAWADEVTEGDSVYDNAQALVRYAQRLRRGLDKLDQLIAKTERDLSGTGGQPPRPSPPDSVKRDVALLRKHGVKHLRFVSSDGLHILCGVDDKSNDGLLRVFSSGRHLWLHARDYPGSHVLILVPGPAEIPRRTIEEAALIAAFHSKGRDETELEVSYLPLKHVRRVKGGKPGQVLKTQEKVISVRPQHFERLKENLGFTEDTPD